MKFPIIVGEFGSKFEDPRDLIHLQDFSKWMKETFKNPSWLYWAYNQNSGDTGGIVKNNWQDIDWRKVLWLRKNMI
jgi:endoglucanase